MNLISFNLIQVIFYLIFYFIYYCWAHFFYYFFIDPFILDDYYTIYLQASIEYPNLLSYLHKLYFKLFYLNLFIFLQIHIFNQLFSDFYFILIFFLIPSDIFINFISIFLFFFSQNFITIIITTQYIIHFNSIAIVFSNIKPSLLKLIFDTVFIFL